MTGAMDALRTGSAALPAMLLAALLLAGCARPAGDDGAGEDGPRVDVAQASCVEVSRTPGDGYQGTFVTITWSISASGTAAGPPDTRLVLSTEPRGEAGEAWNGDASATAMAWHPDGPTAVRRNAGDAEATSWTVEGITASHNDADADGPDNVAFEYDVTAAAGRSGEDHARDSMLVRCS